MDLQVRVVCERFRCYVMRLRLYHRMQHDIIACTCLAGLPFFFSDGRRPESVIRTAT